MILRRLLLLFLPGLLALGSSTTAHAQWNPQRNPRGAGRASFEGEEGLVRATVARLALAIQARDASTWRALRLDIAEGADLKNLGASLEVERVGLSPDGGRALARYVLTVWGQRGAEQELLKRGVQDLALSRGAEAWQPSASAWDVPDETLDALQELTETAREEWLAFQGSSAAPQTVAAGSVAQTSGPRRDEILHLVAERRGGRWIGLRKSLWNGRVLSPQALAQRENVLANAANAAGANAAGATAGRAQSGSTQWIAAELARRARASGGRGGTLHLLLQSGARDWVGLDGVWEPRLSEVVVPPSRFGDLNPQNQVDEREPAPLSDEAASQAPALRVEIARDPALFGDTFSHRRLAQVLEGAGLFGEAADEWEKAALLVPGVASPAAQVSRVRLDGARARREWDPRTRAANQLRDEKNVGLDLQHPDKVISLLKKPFEIRPTPLGALRIGLEYSKLGDDRSATLFLEEARRMMRVGTTRMSADDSAWAEVLAEHLEQRRQLAPIKPPNLLASFLFTVRCRLDDQSVLPLLAALEAAQHTVYADFRLPMGATEVVLWRTQKEFQDYTSRFSAQGNSEFVAALTLTKLIATESGPLVLGEEVNVFVDSRLADSTFGTVAHEYGHVAVRQMSKGRAVPVWFNEGLATVVEGGYDGAIERVKGAARARRLLSMRELQLWNVDGERAFLAYSQANSIVDFIIETWGAEYVLNILRQIGAGVPSEQAFSNVLGISTDALWKRWAREGIQ